MKDYLARLSRAAGDGWMEFWFRPSDAATLALIRILLGAMLFYTHLVWSLGLEAFFGAKSWVGAEAAGTLLGGGEAAGRGYTWSYFWLLDSPGELWAVHMAALVVFGMLTVGLFSRAASVLAWLAALAYVNRVPGALFGLDQINCMLAMYLMLGPSGDAWSLDRLLAARRAAGGLGAARPTVGANVAIRLIQVHMCVIYLHAALAKLQGETWWTGEALWYAVANLEYQSLDLTWLARWPLLIAILTQVTLYWELTFSVFIWPRLTRPLMLMLAVPVHMGIALCMGMMTFGLVMLIGCVAFVPPEVFLKWDLGNGEGARE